MARLTTGDGGPGSLVVLLLLVAAVLASCAERRDPTSPSASATTTAATTVSSNTLFSDYATTSSCEPCHADKVDSWLRSPMHNMTREPALADVHGPFDGSTFTFKEDTARLETVGRGRFVTLASKRFGSGIYRLTRVIGGHHREDYAGVAVTALRADAPVAGDAEELVMPVSWVFPPAGSPPGTKGTLRYKGYSVMVKERPGLHAGPVWSQTCIFCHNTPTYLSTVLGALAGPGVKPYQGEVVDPLLPVDKRATWKVTDPAGLSSVLETELARMGAKRSHPTPAQAVDATRRSFRREHLVELGIGCEACHLGAAEHVSDPRKRPSFAPKSAVFTVSWPTAAKGLAQQRAAGINRACARCHQVLFSGYEPTWEGGSRHGNAGGSHINSGEARDFLLGACSSTLSCAECHDPHAADGTAKLRALPAAAKDALCTKCHGSLATADALRAHAHHDPAGEGARCMSCHMPRKNLALDGSSTPYHRIGSPNDPQRVLLDRPIECALCHADRTVESLAGAMEGWWKRPFDRDVLRTLYGALDANVLLATAERGKPHEQAIAFYALGEARVKGAVPVLAAQLTHPYPLVRGYAKRALDRVTGSVVPIDIDGEDAAIEAATKSWLLARP